MNKNRFEIEEYIEFLAQKDAVKSFYPMALCKKLNLSLSEVVSVLDYLVQGGKLEIGYEIRCDDNHVIIRTDTILNFYSKELFCEFCDDKISITEDNIYPLYYINEEYKDHVKKNFKTPICNKNRAFL